jgi:hypothetical protein
MKSAILIVGLSLLVGVTVLLAGDAVAPQDFTSVSFAKAITFDTSIVYPSSLAAGDLTQDGFPGIAVVSPDNTETPLEYALGKGNGHFRAWRNNDNVGNAPGFVLLADVYGDGNLDAITTDVGGDDLFVAFGDGKRLLVDGVQATFIAAVADLNGDGIPDIVGTTDTGIFVILGKGDRKFAKAVTFSSGGQNPYGIAVGDLNHDGIPDLVVANYGTEQNGDYGNIAVLLGKGDGTSFDPPVLYPIGKYEDPSSLILGDFNGDGNLDIAVTTLNSHAVHVMLGHGDGTFSRPRSFFASSTGAGSIVTADFNGDGRLDLAVTSCYIPNPCYVAVLLGSGDGTFQPPVKFPIGGGPTQLVVADFTNDGKPDLATVGTGPHDQGHVSILLNTTQFPTPSQPPSK